MSRYFLFLLAVSFLLIAIIYSFFRSNEKTLQPEAENVITETFVKTAPEIITPLVETKVLENSLPKSKTLVNDYHVFQTFNNCGPAALSMALSYYGIEKSQIELGNELRPYQNPQGIDDDKSVTLEELSQKAEEHGLISYHRPNGSVELIKNFIAEDIPVITRTRSTEYDDIGHYRVVKGYNDETEEFLQDDSLQGHNLTYSYTHFVDLWRMFNYEYVVLVPKGKQDIAKRILADEIDPKLSWDKAVKSAKRDLELDPTDIYAKLNLSVALYHTGDLVGAVEAFEEVESSLPLRALWYQIEPIQAYFELGYYERVFALTDTIINNHNPSFSELYLIRGNIYKLQGNLEAAKAEFELAYKYNVNMIAAKEALDSSD